MKGEPAMINRIGHRLRRERESQNLSQAALADLTGVARGQISQIENGRHTPSVATVRALCRGLAVQWPALLGWVPE